MPFINQIKIYIYMNYNSYNYSSRSSGRLLEICPRADVFCVGAFAFYVPKWLEVHHHRVKVCEMLLKITLMISSLRIICTTAHKEIPTH